MEYDKKSLQNTYNYINNIYDNLTFYELYSNSIIIFILITLIVFLIASYCYVMTIKTKIASNWNNERCSPINIPFAGLINKPNDKTILQYTSENFKFCISSIFLKIISYIIQPFIFLIYGITNSYYLIDESINNIRLIINNIRINITNIIINIINKAFNVLIVFQQIIISLKDSFSKLGGVLSTCLYFVLALYLFS
jgi:hypothetical protein